MAPNSCVRILERVFLKVRGPDAQRYLQGMITGDVGKAAQAAVSESRPSGGRAFLLDVKGKSVTELTFLARAADEFWLAVPADRGEATHAALDRLLIADDVTLELVSSPTYVKVYRVPDASAESVPTFLPPSVPDAKDRVSLTTREAWGLRILRSEFGPRDEEWWVEDESKLPELEICGDEAWTKLRIEKGVPEWGVDLSPDSLILEFPLDDSVSFHKGCYIGQEVIARATYRGKMTRGFCRFESTSALVEGFVATEAEPDKPVGKITTVQGKRGLGLVRFAAIEGGAVLVQKTPTGEIIRIEKAETIA